MKTTKSVVPWAFTDVDGTAIAFDAKRGGYYTTNFTTWDFLLTVSCGGVWHASMHSMSDTCHSVVKDRVAFYKSDAAYTISKVIDGESVIIEEGVYYV